MLKQNSIKKIIALLMSLTVSITGIFAYVNFAAGSDEAINILKDKEHKMNIEDLENSLTERGFSDDKVSESKMVVEKMYFSLSEIIRKSGQVIPDISNEFDNSLEDMEDISQFEELFKKIDIDEAIYYTLALQKHTESVDKALDEYLYSLQIEVDISLYITDKEEFEKQISKRSEMKSRTDAITVSKIENKLAKMLNNSKQQEIDKENNSSPASIDDVLQLTPKSTSINGTETQNPFINMQLPKPPDPTLEVMNEIESITKNNFN